MDIFKDLRDQKNAINNEPQDDWGIDFNKTTEYESPETFTSDISLKDLHNPFESDILHILDDSTFIKQFIG